MTQVPDTVGNKRRPSEITFFRLVPGPSPVHRLWAGTKILLVLILSVTASLRPDWVTLGTVTGIVLCGFVVARVPPSALPHLPRWFFIALVASAALSVRSTVPPTVHLLGTELSIGGLGDWARLTLLTTVLVLAAGLLGWTTPLGEIAPALTRLAGPLRRTRLPVDEYITAVALSLRSLPLLVVEARTLFAARRLRGHRQDAGARHAPRRAAREINELLIAAIRVSIRHADDVGDAIASRGGSSTVNDPASRPRPADYATLVAVVLIAGALLAL
jgi:energy-coupling factor transporter transmembrane protein EcfT